LIRKLEEVVNKDTDKEAQVPASVFIIAEVRQSAADPDQIRYTLTCQGVTTFREFLGAIGPFWAR